MDSHDVSIMRRQLQSDKGQTREWKQRYDREGG